MNHELPAQSPGPTEQQKHAAPHLDSLARMYIEHHAALYNFFYRQIGNAQDAEDLTAETFTKALTSLGRYQEQGRFDAWLWSIARHTLRDAQRRYRPHADVCQLETLPVEPERGPEAQAIEAEQIATLEQLLKQLPLEQRMALVLRFFCDLSTRDIADTLGRSTGAIKMLVHRAVATLRRRYRQLEQLEATLLPIGASIALVLTSWVEYLAGAPRWQPAMRPVPCPVAVSPTAYVHSSRHGRSLR